MKIEQISELGLEALGMTKILCTKRSACNFIFVRWTDASTGRADFLVATALTRSFSRDIQRRMERQDERACFTDAQPGADLDSCPFQTFYFFEKLIDGEHDSIADIAFHPGSHDPAWNQMKRSFHSIDYQCMASIVPTLKSDDSLGAFGQPVN
jgi:hypothetical protein